MRDRIGMALVATLLVLFGVPFAPPPAVAARIATAEASPTPPAVRPLCGPPAAGRLRCHAIVRTDVAPMLPGEISPAIVPSGYGPAQLQDAYDLAAASASNGSGLTIAVVAAYDLPTAESDLATYRAQFGLPACTAASGCFTKVDQRGGTDYPAPDAGWGGEIALDLDMVSATCPLCSILLVEADSNLVNDLGDAVNTAVALGADVVSNSYGGPEAFFDPGFADAYFDHPGVAVTVSTGDDGYGVSFPASAPHVIAVGGTSLTPDGSPRGWQETAWSGAGSGCSKQHEKTPWQGDACAHRTVADVSAVADPNTGVAVYSTVFGGWVVAGGTSASAPIIGGIYGLAGAPAAGSQPGAYPYWRDATYDVTSGSNGGCGGTYLCTAGPGYDGPTGLGTPAGIAAFRPVPFLDIATSGFAPDIVWLFDAAITAGCSPSAFCPFDTVTRGQMAAFLDRALDLPPTPLDFFADDAGSSFQPSINRLAAAGITSGCGSNRFCPLGVLDRGQTAAFLDRAFHLAPTATDFFADDETSDFEPSINRLAASGITSGCGAATFCPDDPVSRAQMAAFLHRALP
jgi:hypothetical protein